MRTTVTVDDELLARARGVALREGRTLGAVVEDALREMLNRQAEPPERPLRLITADGDGLVAGVDLDDSAALLEHMDAADATA